MQDTRHFTFRPPTIADGATLWNLARGAGKLDVNSSYAYLLWARDFSATSVLASIDGAPAGFITAFIRPDSPDTLMVWQVAVAPTARRSGLAIAMLDHLTTGALDRGVRWVETTVTPDNEPSMNLFRRFASRRGAAVDEQRLFDASLFPDPHDPEHLLRIGPLG